MCNLRPDSLSNKRMEFPENIFYIEQVLNGEKAAFTNLVDKNKLKFKFKV